MTSRCAKDQALCVEIECFSRADIVLIAVAQDNHLMASENVFDLKFEVRLTL